jgi:2-dehydro-3-deoxyphosphogluconate aldolase/(4S)-4-hydroxy-2-oxoglutarate aldolase
MDKQAQVEQVMRAAPVKVDGALPGAGTVLSRSQIDQVEKAGAKFMVSPGSSPRLLDAAEDSPVPLLPGAATPSEMMALAERGYRHLKFFPAEQAGGSGYLKALTSPLQQLRFCPTGGITPDLAPRYLSLGNVLCVGGSWLAPADRIASRDWAGIAALARNAAKLRG